MTSGGPVYNGNWSPTPNSLNDLTNRENRIFNPRFTNDYYNASSGKVVPNDIPDGIPDDLNADGINDYAPTLYYSAFLLSNFLNERTWPPAAGNTVGTPVSTNIRNVWNADVAAFPYVYAYSTSQYVDGNSMPLGSYHSLDPTVTPAPTASRPFFGTVLDPAFNHNPIDIGDSLSPPDGHPDLVGLPHLARNPLAQLARSGPSTQRPQHDTRWLSGQRALLHECLPAATHDRHGEPSPALQRRHRRQHLRHAHRGRRGRPDRHQRPQLRREGPGAEPDHLERQLQVVSATCPPVTTTWATATSTWPWGTPLRSSSTRSPTRAVSPPTRPISGPTPSTPSTGRTWATTPRASSA